MPITQDRMKELIETARRAANECAELRALIKQSTMNAPSGSVLDFQSRNAAQIPITDLSALAVEEYHFRKFGKRNEKEARRMAWKRHEKGTMTRESGPIARAVDPMLGQKPSPERLRELAALEREAEEATAAIDNPDEFANETEEEMLVRFRSYGWPEADVQAQLAFFKKGQDR